MGRAGWTALLAICALWSPSPSAAAPDDDGASTADVLAVVDSLWSAGGRDSSQAVIEAHLPRARAEADSALLRGLLQRYGAHLVSFGDNPRAEVVLREAIALAEAQADSASLLNSVRWLSVAVGGKGGPTKLTISTSGSRTWPGDGAISARKRGR